MPRYALKLVSRTQRLKVPLHTQTSILEWNSRECSVVELGWNSGGLWWNWGGAQGSAQRWNCGGAAVGCGGTAEGWDTERNCTNTCTHLQVEHRNKQNQLQNETNYKTKPIAKPDQQPMPIPNNTISIQNANVVEGYAVTSVCNGVNQL